MSEAVMTNAVMTNAPSAAVLLGDIRVEAEIVYDFAHAIEMMAQAINDENSSSLKRLAWTIKRSCDAIEGQQQRLWQLLHPNPERVAP